MLSAFLSIFVGFLVFWLVAPALPWLFRLVAPLLRRLRPALAADLLFLLELVPCAAACIAVCLFVLPGFATWEPKHSQENVPGIVLVISLFALAMFARSLLLACKDLRRSHSVAERGAMIAVVGCVRPRVIVAAEAHSLLEVEELDSVLDHERAHVQRQDNLRLFLSRIWERLTPGASRLAPLRQERLRQTELAADESAATSIHAALRLASALVKVANTSFLEHGALASTFAGTQSQFQLGDRVHRLLNCKPTAQRRLEVVVDALALATITAGIVVLAMDTRVQYGCYRLLEKIVSG